ncbi:ATP-binding protein [Streptomyces lunaelactis]|uniref:ATP-binding protein n=1 Tax=Streptomyces lunaelactis TaxID=1535768 RepID=UPI0015844EA7|nr:ATP-binding protein [Streptomyces lunaelactis]NUL03141.1 ATP-binding protein [Streptomyces lunaelactis]
MKSQIAAPRYSFTVRLSSTRRGARLARQLVLSQLDMWGFPYGSPIAEAAAAVAAELSINAITHGRTRGRDFGLNLTRTTRTLRIAVSDTRPDRLPPEPGTLDVPPPDADGGRGLLLVDSLAVRRGCDVRDAIVKTIWAELALTQE